ncbi:MAG: OmpA family protein [Polaribacter sp.]
MAQSKGGSFKNNLLIKIGANLVDNSGDRDPFNLFDIHKMAFTNQYAVGLDYIFHDHWSAGLFLSNNKFKANKGELDGIIINKDLDYFAVDLNVKYYLWNIRYADTHKNRFNIYLSGGAGGFKIVDNTLSLNVGGGLMYWLNDSFALNLESVAKFTTKGDVNFDSSHFQHFAGIIYKPWGKRDRDGDGVPDAEDACPDTFGLKEFKGCPDSDNDGVPDSEDACPNKPGLLVNNGCPDTDKDGIIDSLDKCIHIKGPKENNGCPYKDSDNDGVLDKDDACPNVKGNQANGCPKVEVEKEDLTKSILNNYTKIVYFKIAKYNLSSESYSVLNEIISMLKKYPKTNIYIEGYTDSTGSNKFNEKLSENRADAVRNYLINKGISKENMNEVWFGDLHPAASNKSRKGRALNRRVVIKLK